MPQRYFRTVDTVNSFKKLTEFEMVKVRPQNEGNIDLIQNFSSMRWDMTQAERVIYIPQHEKAYFAIHSVRKNKKVQTTSHKLTKTQDRSLPKEDQRKYREHSKSAQNAGIGTHLVDHALRCTIFISSN